MLHAEQTHQRGELKGLKTASTHSGSNCPSKVKRVEKRKNQLERKLCSLYLSSWNYCGTKPPETLWSEALQWRPQLRPVDRRIGGADGGGREVGIWIEMRAAAERDLQMVGTRTSRRSG